VISVRFKPTAAGSASGSLTVVSNAPGSALAVALSGTGMAPPTNINPTIFYQVVNSNSGDCVDDTNGAVSDGTAVQQWTCTVGDTNQEWQFLPTSGGYYEVVALNDTSEAWDVTGGPGATSDGTPIELWTYSGGTNQQWLPTLQSNGSYTFTARNSGNECLDVTNHSTANGTQLQQWTCIVGDTAQAFQLTPAS
jgi:glucosylceramidase